MNRHSLQRVASVAAQSSEWVILIVLLAVSIPPILVQHRALSIVPNLNLLDGSWLLDTSYKASGRLWFGRDVAFTYGPLFEWLSSEPSRWIGVSTGAIYATWYTLPFFVIILSTFFCARLLLPEAGAWRRALFVLLAVVVWSPPDVRVSVCLLTFAIFVRLTDKVSSIAAPLGLPALGAGILCAVAFLLSADTGLYTVAALLLCVAGSAVAKGRTARLAKFVFWAATGFAVCVVLINAGMFSPLNFSFWKSSLTIATAYRWFEPLPMIKANKRLVLETIALGLVVFCIAWRFRSSSGPWTRRASFLLAAFFLAVGMMQTCLVRSDDGHVVAGIYPMIFLCAAIALDEHGAPYRLSFVLPALVVAATLIFGHAFSAFSPRNIISRSRQMLDPVSICPQGSQEFDRACFPARDTDLLSGVAVYVGLHAAPGRPIAIFPYQTVFGLASRHQVAGGVLQSYLVNGDYLTGLEVSGLEKSSPELGLYFADGIMSVGIDSVPNFTRSPGVWFYLLRHYRGDASLMPAMVGLVRDDSREGQVTLSGDRIVEAPAAVAITARKTEVSLGEIHWPATGADLLKVRLKVNYPFWWRLRKPSNLSLKISFADGSEKAVNFVVQPNQTSDIWIYLWDDTEMGRYFLADQSKWESESHPAISGLKLLIAPFDWISVVPDGVAIERVEAVRLASGAKSVD